MNSRLMLAASLAVAGPWGTLVRAEPAPAPDSVRQILLERPVQMPSNGFNLRVVSLKLPKGYKSPLHTHEGPGPRYVAKGKVRIEEGGQTHEYGPGQVFWETGNWLTVENLADGESEVVAVELPKGK